MKLNTSVGIKLVLKRFLSPRVRSKIKRILGKGSFDEVEIVFELLHRSAKHKVMIDVGAHHGGSLEWFAREGWEVFAFEPDRDNRQPLELMCQYYPTVTIDNRAVSDTNKENQAFFSSEVSSGISGLAAFHPSHEESESVTTTTLSAFCDENEITNIDFLKIDTEGYDLFVLKGFPWTKIKPLVILCEFEDRKTKTLGYDFHELAEFLQHNGYVLLVSEWHPMTEYGTRHEWREFKSYPCELADPSSWGNVIAVRDGNLQERLIDLSKRYSTLFG